MSILKNKIIKFLFKLCISIAFIAWLIVRIDWKQVLFYLQRISFWQVALYIAVLIAGMVVSAYKWKILAELRGFSISLGKSFQLYLTGTFINNFMPSFIGGDAYRTYQISKENKKYIAATASVVIDRITGLLGAMILSVIFALYNWQVIKNYKVLIIIVAVIVLLLVAVAGIEVVARFSFWKKLSSFVPKKIIEAIKDFAEYGNNKRIIFKSLMLAIIFNLIGVAAVNYILFLGFGINIGISDYLSVIFLISIVSAIPVSINNIGIKEWAYVTFFGFFGINASAVVAIALVSRVLQMIVSFAAFPYYMKNK